MKPTTTFWQRLINRFRVKSAIKHAIKMREMTKKQHFVIQIYGKIRVYDRNKIDSLIRHGVLSPQLKDYLQLCKFSIYYTKQN